MDVDIVAFLAPEDNKEPKLTELLEICTKHPLCEKLPSWTNWNNPRTLQYFIALNLTFYLIVIGRYSLLTLFCYLFICLLFLAFMYRFIMSRIGSNKDKEDVKAFFEALKDINLSRKVTVQHVETCFHLYAQAWQVIATCLHFEQPLFAVKFAGLCLVLGQLGNLLTGFGLLWLLINVAFLGPVIYEKKKDQIDDLYTNVVSLVQEQAGGVFDKIPPLALTTSPKAKAD
eukprot:TRINITY_DN10562_c0_g1_i1.p1 TRINITY_DN10562_c0_g1~~TRINITY_DN10562_c0_g1_i1.p1  ORF type:complete len:229 (+),score=35.42 TRINITY_DN10562_c0_g1_i1:15-701(+)